MKDMRVINSMDDVMKINDIIDEVWAEAVREVKWPPDGVERSEKKKEIAMKYQLPHEENKRIFKEQIILSLFGGKEKSEKPKILITGGLPGVGKTAALIPMLQRRNPNAILAQVGELALNHTDRDRIKKEHPSEFEEATLMDAYIWLNAVNGLALRSGNDLILERTLRSLPQSVVDDNTRNGYETEFHVLTASDTEVRFRLFEKYIEGLKREGESGRLTDIDFFEEVLAKMPATMRELERNGNSICVYKCGNKELGKEPEEPELVYPIERNTHISFSYGDYVIHYEGR